jgi:branched-chain amino acid transport system permease protein
MRARGIRAASAPRGAPARVFAALRPFLPVAALAGIVVAVQLVLGAAGFPQYLVQLTMAAYYSLAALGLFLFMGYAGQVSLGHAGFLAIGGYASASVATANLLPLAASPVVAGLAAAGLATRGVDLYGVEVLRLSPWLGPLAGLLLAAATAVLLGLPSLRLRGHYLAMATLSFGIIVQRIVLGTPALGAADGIPEITALRIAEGLAVSGRKALRVPNYYLAWTLVALALLLLLNLARSRAGRALKAIHGDEDAAAALGVDAGRAKLAAFVVSALFAALAGSMLAHYNGSIGPSEASVMKSVRYVALVAAGGMGSAGGVLAVSTLLTFLSLRGVFGLYDDAVFAAILVAIMLFAPDGLFRAIWMPGRRRDHGRAAGRPT